jgi:TolB-like protein
MSHRTNWLLAARDEVLAMANAWISVCTSQKTDWNVPEPALAELTVLKGTAAAALTGCMRNFKRWYSAIMGIIKRAFRFFVSCMLGFFLVTACTSQEPTAQSTPARADPATAVPAQTVEVVPAQTVVVPAQIVNPFYTGDGAKGVSIAILPLKDRGLTADQDYLPALVQGEFVSNFKGYSAISVLDRAQLDNQYAELLSGYYEEDAKAGMDLGHLTPTDYILGGSVTKTATGYAMQIQITKSADKMTIASYSGTCTFIELDNLTGVRRASLDLLQKMGVQPTERTRTELAGAARAQVVAAQTADARGYTADRGGRTAEAAIYYTQAAAIDPSMLQTANRASTLTASIASGSIGAGTRDLIQQRKDWIDLLTETEETIYKLFSSASENPPYALCYSNDIKWGNINYQTESRDARFETNLQGHGYWFDSVRIAAQRVYGAVYDGLTRTGHKNEWGLGNWPGSGVTRQNPFSMAWRHDITVVFELVNEEGKTIGRQTYSRRPQYSPQRDGNRITAISYAADDFVTLSFNGVKAADISDHGMSIRVALVNGAPPEQTPFQIRMIPYWEITTALLIENGVVKGFRSGVDAGRYRDLVIPATRWSEQVTAIGSSAFEGNALTSLVISDGVTTIWNSAFSSNALTDLVIPGSVTYIGDGAFSDNALTNLVISDGVTTIGREAFSSNALTSLVIPGSVTTIGREAFSSNALTSLVIPDSVTYIGDGAFRYNALTSLVIPGSITTIGDGVFRYNSLTGLVIPDGVTTIGWGAFSSNALTDLVIPGSVTYIGDGAFSNNSLISVVIPASVTDIDSYSDGNGTIELLRDVRIQVPITRFAGANVSYKEAGNAIRYDNRPVDFPKFYKENGMKAGKYTYEYSNSDRQRDGSWRGTPKWRYSPE